MRTTTTIAVAAAFALGGLVGSFALRTVNPTNDGGAVTNVPHPVWSEVQWPFLRDQWGEGKAFQCKAVDCGTEVKLYLRAKIGFCNCATGVVDDEENSNASVTSISLAASFAARYWSAYHDRVDEGP